MKSLVKLTILILFINLLELNANGQTKYEFANITFNMYDKTLSVTIDDKEFSETKMDIPKDEKSWLNAKPLFAKVKEFQEKGWELMTFSNISSQGFLTGYLTIAYMKRKKE
jgi:hypothetical protein